MTGGGSAGRETLGGIGVDGDNASMPVANAQAETLPGPPAKLTVAQLEQQLKQQEKAAKKAHKEAKKVGTPAVHLSARKDVAPQSKRGILQRPLAGITTP